MKKYSIIFGKTVAKKLKKIKSQKDIAKTISKIFDKIEKYGPQKSKLLDSKLNLYEIKNKRPPIRIYFKVLIKENTIEIIDFHNKKSKTQQQYLIEKIKKYIKDQYLLAYIFFP